MNPTSETPDPAAAWVAAQWQHDRPLISCRFDPTGTWVFSGSEDAVVERFHLADGAKTILSGGHSTWVAAMAFSPDGSAVVTGGCDGRLTWWPTAAESPEPLRSIPGHGTHWIRSLATGGDGNILASGGNDHAVRLWNLTDGTLLRELSGHEKHVYSVSFSPDGQTLYSGDLAGTVRQWDPSTGAEIRKYDAAALYSYNSGQGVDFGGVRALELSPDSKYLAAGGLHKASNPLGAVHEPLVLLFNPETGEIERQLIAEGITGGVIWRLRWLKDGTLMGVTGGGSGGWLLFWKPDSEKDFHRFQLPNIARDMDLHPDGVRVATAHHDRHLRITNLTAKPS